MVATWKACFDESYDEGGWFVTAGVLAKASQWRSFYPKWRAALAADQSIPYFTRKDAGRINRKDSVFYGWSRTRVRKKVAALSRVIRETTDKRLVIAFRLRDFRYVMDRISFGGQEEYKDEYLYGFFGSLMVLCDHMDQLGGRQRKPLMVFDRWPTAARQQRALELHGRHVREFDPKNKLCRWMGPLPKFLADRPSEGAAVEVGLQAADLVAWQYRNALKRASENKAWVNHHSLGRRIWGHEWGRKNATEWAWTLKRYLEAKRAEVESGPGA